MMNNFAKWTLVGALAILSACNNQPHTGRVAILDIAVVSEKTGGTEKMGNQLKAMQAKYQADLSKLQSDLQAKISDRQKEFGKKPPTDEQRQEMSRMMGNAQREYNEAQAAASQAMQQEQAKLVLAFRDKIRPVARQVAESKGLSVILLKNEALVLDADPSLIITDAVVAELLKMESPVETASPESVVEPVAEPVTEQEPAVNETMMDATHMKEEPMPEMPATADPAK